MLLIHRYHIIKNFKDKYMIYKQALVLAESGNAEIFQEPSGFKVKEASYGKYGEINYTKPSNNMRIIASAVVRFLKAKHPEWLSELKNYNLTFPDLKVKGAGNISTESNVEISSEDGKKKMIITAKMYKPYL